MTTRSVDDLAQLCFTLAREEMDEIMDEIKPRHLTASEMVAILTVLRPVRERLRQPAPVLQLVGRPRRF